jgi:hypothetical protein
MTEEEKTARTSNNTCGQPNILSTVIAQFALGTGLDRLVPKLKLQKLNFWLNLDKKVARQMPMVAA